MTQSADVWTLTVAGVTTKMSGTYSCVASNVAGTAKCSAVVTVVGKQPVSVSRHLIAARIYQQLHTVVATLIDDWLDE